MLEKKGLQEDGRPGDSLPVWLKEGETRVSSPVDTVGRIQSHLLESAENKQGTQNDGRKSEVWREPQKVMQRKWGSENRFLKLHVQNQAFNNQVRRWSCDLEGGCWEQKIKKYTTEFSTRSHWTRSCNSPNTLGSDQISLSVVSNSATPWIAARQASLSITNSRSSPRLTSIESVMPSSHLILCRPLLLLHPIPPSIRVFSNESTLAWGGQSTGVSALASNCFLSNC